MSHTLDILGGITAEQFMSEYWQKKPLLVRQALPELVDLLTPEDVQTLALEEHVTARLIKQKDKDPSQWSVKSSPLIKGDFQKLPKKWTLLVQAVDHYSFELSELWNKFSFIPQWRRDDIMVSYAPQGGSVGQHFDFYDVFLVQGHGHRRWQLGQHCDEHTALQENQPLKLLTEMQVNFDEVLAPGDLLYVPPGLSHFGVAEDECLTYSFGFRMPNVADLMDRISDQFADTPILKNPLLDLQRDAVPAGGKIQKVELDYLKSHVIEQLKNSDAFDAVIAAFMSELKYPDSLTEPDELEADDLREVLNTGFELMREPASRLLYIDQDLQQDQPQDDHHNLSFFANGEQLCVATELHTHLKQIADGESVNFDQRFEDDEMLEDLANLLNESVLMLLPPEEAEDE